MAIVIPAAIEGLHIASLAGTVAARKGEAARVAQRVLTENLVTTNWNQSAQSGTVTEGQRAVPLDHAQRPLEPGPQPEVLFSSFSVEVQFSRAETETTRCA